MQAMTDAPALQLELSDTTDDAVLAHGATTTMTVEKTRALVKMFADVTASPDIEAFLSGFTDDCVVWYPPDRPMQGKPALREFLSKRANRSDFTCTKQLRTINGNVLGVTWVSQWVDPNAGTRHERRGVEFWIMRGEQIARWDCSTTTYPIE
jgi:ketosteroid isomerase-like protein